ncbi:putative bifunctional diguanylate cyclase/phosphodiesterase [Alteromonas macleodii]|jgi:diguanylate cyclase (GGDEF)-like protein|uniref:putative bifunctional diguanylate cyclase/phosphodiesterase n=1 Tax=Alteromonas macleodii TaxID=28108 RepID=UPI0001AEC5C9|nr:EAL domain-containing protein [Alteromonas macleodii]MBS08692.1 GGDEF-domain containing protein [Alteromonas sp.]MEE3306379.1 EAL domain-containing protein [Pseudomonadota bacterium]AFS35636.1 GGDEF/EAL domain-containing protein [Alteromonas macleodii ATCC 27126]MCH2256908.1 EAL domain-containing protein [Alteromonas sp.]RZP36462.1 MAG: EAL domain-containing protein [Alteromonas sp.]|tara:strand:+ start:2932 stop:5376 length:2445 start_codon:yes stop_codon:yes gene_type:complete
MKVQVSFTTKTITILLAMVLTVAVVISTVLIQESDARILLQQRENQVSNQRRVQLFEDILHGRMITLIDIISHKSGGNADSLESLQQTLSGLSEYLTLNFQVESLYLFDEHGVVGNPLQPVNKTIEKLVNTTRASFESRSLLSCDSVCTHYISIPIMANGETLPVIVVSTSMRELLYLFSRATDVHKVAVVQHKETSSELSELRVASQVSAANRQYFQSLFDALPDNWRIDDLVIRGMNVALENQQLLVSLLPFNHASGDHPYLLIVQDVSAMVRQNEQYQYIVISSAVALFFIFSSLLYLFLNQYRIRLLDVSERLPMLAEHKFSEFYTIAAKRRKSPIFKFTDELDVVEDAANNLARQLESFDGQMAINTAKLEKMAMFDVLTGLPNRNMLTFQIEKQLAGSIRDDRLVALMFMDLDDFKKVNDSHGHDVGDKLLKAAAMRISKPIRESDIASRFGGDEFVILLSNIESKKHVDTVAKKLIEEFKEPIIVDGVTFYVSISIGIAITNHSRATPVELLRHADIAMYEAKAKKGAEYRVYDATMNLKVMQKVELESEAREALRDNQFSLALQPQIEMHTGRLVGFEALLRWQHPKKGNISPADFIPLLENTSFMLELDYWVITRSTYLIRELKNSGYPDVKMAINLSAGQFLDPSLPEFLQQQIIKNDIAPDQVCLELTETVLVSDIKRATTIMQNIRDMGCMLAIDDFGTGYSSLSYLKSLPADYIKIDRSFVANIASSADDRNIVHSTISMVRNMGMQVVAEGIETSEQYELLCHFDCNLGQGYLISRPIPEVNIWDVLSDKVEFGFWKESA